MARALCESYPSLTAERADADTASITRALMAARLVLPV